MKHILRFDENGEFRVLVLSDLHVNKSPVGEETLANIRNLTNREKPDLVLFSGDNTDALMNTDQLREILTQLVSYIEEKQIPWAHVFGNHDDTNLSREKQEPIYESFEYCISKTGDNSLAGVGNYYLPVFASNSDKIKFNIWALDSLREMTDSDIAMIRPVCGAFMGMTDSHYDYIRPSQIQWYMNTSKQLEDISGMKIPAMMYFHIPLQENYTAWLNRNKLNYTGEKREGIGAGEINSGLFAAVLERGDVKAIINGHDHNNDYMLDYCGVKLCACATPSTYGYYEPDMLGGRVVVIKENNPSAVETYMSYISERRISPPMPL